MQCFFNFQNWYRNTDFKALSRILHNKIILSFSFSLLLVFSDEKVYICIWCSRFLTVSLHFTFSYYMYIITELNKHICHPKYLVIVDFFLLMFVSQVHFRRSFHYASAIEKIKITFTFDSKFHVICIWGKQRITSNTFFRNEIKFLYHWINIY